MIGNYIIVNYIGAFIIIILGLYMLLVKKNLIKIVLGISMVNGGINLLLISLGYREGAAAPSFDTATQTAGDVLFVDPVPQVLALISIIIGACVTALAISLVIKIYDNYGTINSDRIRRLKV